MRMLCILITVGVFGCSSANRIERSANRHEAKAQQLAAAGDYANASKERKSAAKQYSKANTRRGFEDVMPVVFH